VLRATHCVSLRRKKGPDNERQTVYDQSQDSHFYTSTLNPAGQLGNKSAFNGFPQEIGGRNVGSMSFNENAYNWSENAILFLGAFELSFAK